MPPLTNDLAPPTLIRTKLQPPNLPATLVPLPRLYAQLESGYQAGITLVSAPTGFGKSTVVAAWLQQRAQQSDLPSAAWLSLDSADDALPRFLAYVCAAVARLFPDSVLHTHTTLTTSGFVAPEAAAASLIADLDSVPVDYVLVLDDVQQVHTGDVQRALVMLLQQRPQRCHLVLIARMDPALPIAHLRAQGKLIDVRAHSLRFTLPEAAALVQNHAEVRLAEDAASALLQQTEGWVAGLHLALLAVHNAADSAESIQAIPARHKYVTQYLLEEVFLRQLPAIQQCLLQTSILERFNAGLIEAVMGCSPSGHARGEPVCDPTLPLKHGHDLINWLLTRGLFVIALEDEDGSEDGWYRYTHLFAGFLRNHLHTQRSASAVAELHLRASRWFATAGHVDAAVAHALAAGEMEAAADYVEKAVRAALRHEQFPLVKHWLEKLPQEIVDRRVRLLLARCWLHVHRWRLDDMRGLLTKVELLIAEELERSSGSADQRALAGELAGLQCITSCLEHDSAASLAYGYEALAQIAPDHGFAHSTVMIFVALALQIGGDLGDAYAFLEKEMLPAQAEGRSMEVHLLTGLESVAWQAGDLQRLEQAAPVQHGRAGTLNMTASEGWAHLFRGVAHYAKNQLGEARETLACFAVPDVDSFGNGAWAHGIYWLAITLDRLGEHAEAVAMADLGLKIGSERSHVRMIATAQLLHRHLAVLHGDLIAAALGASAWNPAAAYPFLFFAVEDLVQAQYLLAVGTQADLQAAKAILDGWLHHARRIHARRRAVEVLALRAGVYQALDMPTPALADLREALLLAEPHGLVRYFVDVGAHLRPVFAQLTAEEQERPFAGYLMACMVPASVRKDVPPGVTWPSAYATLLTAREMDVLGLMNQRYTDKEIAGQLYISVPTVKRHAANIYQKLYVNGRREAVAAALAQGILPAAGL